MSSLSSYNFLPIEIQQPLPRIVGIGASAGGLQALEQLLGSLTTSCQMAYVIVQHLSRDHESNLATILGRATEMPVIFLTEDIFPEPNTIYLRPPDKEVEAHGGKLCLSPRDQTNDSLYLPIDHFLLSLATDQKSYAIAIILSGMGSDGSRGIKSIKEKGGIVLVQSPESAQFSGMPNAAIRFDVADFIGTAPEIATTLAAIAQREPAPDQNRIFEAVPASEFDRFVEKILELIGEEMEIDFTRYRASTIRRRIEKRLLIHMIDEPADYLEMLVQDQEELTLLAQSFLIGVTRFFRDPPAYELLREQLAPQLAERARQGTPLRVWIPACSTGEEAYSIAMVLDEYLSTHHPQLEFKVLASDLDPKAVQIASEAFYPDNVAADVPTTYLEKYLMSSHGGYRVVPKLREKILFAVQNLLTDPPFIHIDLISCRNFLIYVEADAQATVLANFHFALNPEGFLLLGPSESLGRLQRAFATVNRRWKIFSRRAVGNQRLGPGRSAPVLTKTASFGNRGDLAARIKIEEDTGLEEQDVFSQYLSGQYAPTSVFVNKDYEIRYINGNLDRFFHFPRNHARLALGKVLQKEVSTLLRAAVDTLLSNRENDVPKEIILEDLTVDGVVHEAILKEVSLVNVGERLVMIQVNRMDQETDHGETAKVLKPDELLQRRLHTLEERLVLSEQRARKLLNELEATNEELQTSNRELLASNEEMQSTNEELQSVNEELHTVNQEMQHKNDQLKTLNSDINHLLESTEIGTIFLDHDLIIRRFTPSIHRQFDLKPADISRPLSAFSSSFRDLGLVDRCRQVLASEERYEEEVEDRFGKNYLLRILPHLEPGSEKPGLVVSFIDVSDLVRTRTLLSHTAAKYEVLLNNLPDTIAVVDQQTRIEQINRWLIPESKAEDPTGQYIVDILERDGERVRFHQALRRVFSGGKPFRESFHLRGDGEEAVHAEVSFVLYPGVSRGSVSTEDRAILIMRDISELVRERENSNRMLEEYRRQVKTAESQGGLMELNGNIIDLNRSAQPGMKPEDFIQKSVFDFLTRSGSEKIRAATEKLQNGSFREVVEYYDQDLTLPNTGNVMRVAYEPVIANGEVIFLLVKNLDSSPQEE